MSGGVDSSVAAALLAREGHDVVGLSMQLYDQLGRARAASASAPAARSTTSTTPAASPHASAFPTTSSISSASSPSTVIVELRQRVLGRPHAHPCVHCNGDLKFATLVARAEGMGADSSRPGTTRASIWIPRPAGIG